MENHPRPGWHEDVNAPAFIRANTGVMAPPLVPEILLHLADEAVPLWQKTEDALERIGLPPPFWAFAWAGGQALARYILDNPKTVRGRRIIDLASGSGLVAIAAMKSGAVSVLACDIDPFSTAAIRLNAALNRTTVTISESDLLESAPPDVDLITVGDLFYEKTLAERCFCWLKIAKSTGVDILIGDPGRCYLPRDQLAKIREYSVPVSRDLEDTAIKQSAVWQLCPNC